MTTINEAIDEALATVGWTKKDRSTARCSSATVADYSKKMVGFELRKEGYQHGDEKIIVSFRNLKFDISEDGEIGTGTIDSDGKIFVNGSNTYRYAAEIIKGQDDGLGDISTIDAGTVVAK